MDTVSRTVGVIADPGLPESVARAIAARLAGDLSDAAGSRWAVDVSREVQPLTADHYLPRDREHRAQLKPNRRRANR